MSDTSGLGKMNFTHDDETGAAYLTLSRERVVATIEVGPVWIDLDENGRAVGVEWLANPITSPCPS